MQSQAIDRRANAGCKCTKYEAQPDSNAKPDECVFVGVVLVVKIAES